MQSRLLEGTKKIGKPLGITVCLRITLQLSRYNGNHLKYLFKHMFNLQERGKGLTKIFCDLAGVACTKESIL